MTREDELANDGGKAETGQQGEASLYEIKIVGPLEEHWQQWFEGMTLEIKDDAESGATYTVITGPVRDQPALHGLLAAVRDLNLTLISVRRMEMSRSSKLKGDQDGT